MGPSHYLCLYCSSKINQVEDKNSDGKELKSPSSTLNHFLGICNNLLLLFKARPAKRQLSITLSSTLSHAFMETQNLLSNSETKVFIPSPLWWHPSARWIAISHLPIHLHTHAVLASLVAHFGTFISFSYPANLPDKKVVMVLVGNCFITKIPHILPVKEGEKIFPVRIQVIFQTKISGEGIIFDPYDLGDDFCSFFSGGQVPPPPQQGSTFPVVPAFLHHTQVRDKKTASFKARDKNSNFKFGTLPCPTVSHQDAGNMPPPARASGSKWDNIGQTLAPAINKFVSEVKNPSSDGDTSHHALSHHTGLEVSLPLDSRALQSRKRNLAEEETASWSHLLELCSKTLKPSLFKVDQKIPDTSLNLQTFEQLDQNNNSTGTAFKKPADFSLSKLKHDSDSHNSSLVKDSTEGVPQLDVKKTTSGKKETNTELLAIPTRVFKRKKTRHTEADWKLKQLKQWDDLEQGEDSGTQPQHARQKEVTEDDLQKDMKKVASNLEKHFEKA